MMSEYLRGGIGVLKGHLRGCRGGTLGVFAMGVLFPARVGYLG